MVALRSRKFSKILQKRGEEFQVSSRLYISKEIEELGAFRQQTALVKLQLMLRRLRLRGAQRQRRTLFIRKLGLGKVANAFL
jgi:hypothetical protein